MQQRFEGLYNHIVTNRESIDVEFFERLASGNNIIEILQKEGIIFDNGEEEDIKNFMKSFNNVVKSEKDAGSINEDDWNRIKELLKCSSIVDTGGNPNVKRKRPEFVYNGKTYMTQGANRMNLSNLALRLITDYAGETDKTAEELMDMINTKITCYTTVLKNAKLNQISERSNPLLKKKELRDLHFDETVRLGDRELLISKGWGAGELMTLIEILGYDDRVTSNMK
jgi:hypothetical protein